MIDLQTVVMIVVYLIVAAIVFGLLFYLVNYVGSQFPGAEPFIKIARIILVVLAVLVCIGILVSLVSGNPVFRWGHGLLPGRPDAGLG